MKATDVLHARGRGAVALALGATLLLALAAPAFAAGPVRPYRGTGTETSSLVPLMAPIEACPAQTMFHVTGNGMGNFAHLGLAHYTFEWCASANMATGDGWLTKDGSMALVAANGDQLVLTFDLTFKATPLPIPKTAVAHVDWTVQSGTGRFEDATGSGVATWSVVYFPDLTGATSTSVWSGTIAY